LVALGARQRAVLAVLLYRANAVVARSEIVRLVWGPQPADWPVTVDRLVADYVSHLRGALDRAGADDRVPVRLVARAAGFAAQVDPQAVERPGRGLPEPRRPTRAASPCVHRTGNGLRSKVASGVA